MRFALLGLLLTGCPWIASETYDERVEDADGDGEPAVRFGGQDCRDNDASITTCDADRDGFLAVGLDGEDCDDGDPAVNPEARELCLDGIDNDCDGRIDGQDDVDDADLPRWYSDADEDGFGDGDPVASCSAPPGFVDNGLDCDDGRADVNPNALERCDAVDHDCDGELRNNPADQVQWFEDLDGDGSGSTSLVFACDPPQANAVAVGNDCDDTDPTVEGLDLDGDGTDTCGGDCDDTDPSRTPGAVEDCDAIDNDCDEAVDEGLPVEEYWPDTDGDGVGDPTAAPLASCALPAGYSAVAMDCDDSRADVGPDVEERCDGIDNDCDLLVDDFDPSTPDTAKTVWFADDDLDGHGSNLIAVLACDAPAGFVDVDGDCNDLSAAINPESPEFCDAVDNDCDGDVDELAVDAGLYFPDADGDGFGNAALPTPLCDPDAEAEAYVSDLPGFDCNDANPDIRPDAVEICGDAVRQDCAPFDPYDCDADGELDLDHGGQDCDDTDPDRTPGAPETCDGIDNDCDGVLDDDDPDIDLSTATDWFTDLDGDGFGVGAPTFSCQPPPNTASADGDCDDTDPQRFPGQSWYRDRDGDGFGNVEEVSTACSPPAGSVADATDCDDLSAGANPGAVESCDTVDNDCNGLIDDNAVGGSTFYVDNDGDGFGAASLPVLSCGGEEGVVANPDDCNDANADVNPAAEEICYDGVRQDCSAADLDDCDSDGVVGASQGGDDCDDENPEVLPGAIELCDGLDNDCDTLLDDADPDVDLGTTATWTPDGDSDGFGDDAAAVSACSQPVGHVLLGGDCDDTRGDVNPEADETCDGADNDCDGLADDDDDTVVEPPTLYRDIDLDGFGDPFVSVTQCTPPGGNAFVQDATDCNDTDGASNPGAPEICDNGTDNDCDTLVDDNDPSLSGAPTWFRDIDGDGYALLGAEVDACVPPAGYIGTPAAEADCNDVNVGVNPGASEICNAGLDDDCDGLADAADPDLAGTSNWYRDADGDGYGDTDDSLAQCTQPVGYVGLDGDCNDSNPGLNPAATEICDGIDNDCDTALDDADPDLVGSLSWYPDDDGDGFGDGTAVVQCAEPLPPNSHVLVDGDCNDSTPLVSPERPELCNGDIDDDCDGLADDLDDSVVQQSQRPWVIDADGDGRGDANAAGAPVFACVAPAQHVFLLLADDCDDTEALANPTLSEIYYDGIDNDCSAVTNDQDQDGDGFLASVDDCDDDPTDDAQVPLFGRAALVHPGVNDPPYNGIDQDCDGVDDWDLDGDGQAAIAPPGWPDPYTGTLPATDCDDSDPAIRTRNVNVPGAFSTLQAAVDAVCDGQITLSGTRDDEAVVRGTHVSIRGPATLTGMAGHRLLSVQAGTSPDFPTFERDAQVTVTNLTLRDGFAAARGGAIEVSDEQGLTLLDVDIEDSLTLGDGAALYIGQGANVDVFDSAFERNTAANRGGAVFADMDATVWVEGSDFIENGSIHGAFSAIESNRIDLVESHFLRNRHTEEFLTSERANAIVIVQPAQGALLDRVSVIDPPGITRQVRAIRSDSSASIVELRNSIVRTRRSAWGATGLAAASNTIFLGYDGSSLPLIEATDGTLEIRNCGFHEHSGQPAGAIHSRNSRLTVLNSAFSTRGTNSGFNTEKDAFAETSTVVLAHDIRGNAFDTMITMLDEISEIPLTSQAFLPSCPGTAASNFNCIGGPGPTFGLPYRSVGTPLRVSDLDVSIRESANAFMDAGLAEIRDVDGSPSDIGPSGGPFGIDPDYYLTAAGNPSFYDGWEARHGLAPGQSGNGADPDADGETNEIEYALGLSPTLADTDGDGLDDGDEFDLGAFALIPDSDNDGLDDNDEVLAGTSPMEPDSDADGCIDGSDPDPTDMAVPGNCGPFP